jgi:hypothetical protein
MLLLPSSEGAGWVLMAISSKMGAMEEATNAEKRRCR